MKAISSVLGVVLFGSCWLITGAIGCSGAPVQQADATGMWSQSQATTNVGEEQLVPLLSMVSQLRAASQDALEAVKLLGTLDSGLTQAQQDFDAAEQLLQEGKAAYTARQYQRSWKKLQAADTAYRLAEEAAVRAGIQHLEHELATDYGRLLNSPPWGGHDFTGTVRVSHRSANLRDGAGMNFQIIGKAQPGDVLNVLAESGEWYRVRTAAGLVGWVSKTLVIRVHAP